MDIVIVGIVGLVCFLMGAITLMAYMILRMMRNKGWDDSNITNGLRLLSHVTLHAEDFGKMYYLNYEQRLRLETTSTYGDDPLKRPFWYVSEDEFEGVVKTRPD